MSLAADEVRAVADLCVNCKMCAHECPAHVNIPKLMLEAKAANVAQHGLDRSEWFLARLERFARFGSALPLLANFAMASRPLRWAFDKIFGLSARRRLPRLARRTFLSRAKKQGWTRRPDGARPWLAYFADIYANYIDPQIGEATVRVLQHHGFEVYVPPQQQGSGIEALAHGDVGAARESAARTCASWPSWPVKMSRLSAPSQVRPSCCAKIIWICSMSPMRGWSLDKRSN